MGSREHIIVTITDLPDSFIFVAIRTPSFQSRGEFEFEFTASCLILGPVLDVFQGVYICAHPVI